MTPSQTYGKRAVDVLNQAFPSIDDGPDAPISLGHFSAAIRLLAEGLDRLEQAGEAEGVRCPKGPPRPVSPTPTPSPETEVTKREIEQFLEGHGYWKREGWWHIHDAQVERIEQAIRREAALREKHDRLREIAARFDRFNREESGGVPIAQPAWDKAFRDLRHFLESST